jgi:hypothetical protein
MPISFIDVGIFFVATPTKKGKIIFLYSGFRTCKNRTLTA